jgi:uncharacterized protein (DUF58 family)
MILPARKLLGFLIVPAIVLLVGRSRAALALMIAYDLGLFAVVLIDIAVSTKPWEIGLERRSPDHLSLAGWNRIGWTMHNRSRQPVVFQVSEDVPDEIERETVPVAGTILPRSRAELSYAVRPTRRGLYELGDIYVRYRTVLGLLIRQKRFPARTPVRVYPNVANLARYELAAQRHRLAELGLKSARQHGKGTMFESLRDYVPGDDLADIAWKATARRGRLITRSFEAERSQNVLVVIDSGRLMTTQVEKLSRLDYAINAAILLTYVAMKQGDYIGMLAFSDRIEAYLPPLKGRGALGRMNEALYRIEPRLREPNYELACRFLSLRHRKRSLIIMLTDVIDKDASSALLAYAARFVRHHLPVCVTLRNPELEARAASRPAQASDCFAKAVALQMLGRRGEALARMRRQGVDVLDVDPRQLTPRLLDRYLELKRRHRF